MPAGEPPVGPSNGPYRGTGQRVQTRSALGATRRLFRVLLSTTFGTGCVPVYQRLAVVTGNQSRTLPATHAIAAPQATFSEGTADAPERDSAALYDRAGARPTRSRNRHTCADIARSKRIRGADGTSHDHSPLRVENTVIRIARCAKGWSGFTKRRYRHARSRRRPPVPSTGAETITAPAGVTDMA